MEVLEAAVTSGNRAPFSKLALSIYSACAPLLGGATITAAFFAGIFAMTEVSRANVVNGTFAGCTGTVCPPWAFMPAASGSDFHYGPGFTFPTAANFGAEGTLDDEISQSIATSPGVYTISFSLVITDANLDAGSDFSVHFGGTTLFSLFDSGPTSPTTITLSGDATEPTTTLAFFGRNDANFDVLTNVSVTSEASPTPLPGTLPLFASGLGALGLLGRRRKKRATPLAA